MNQSVICRSFGCCEKYDLFCTACTLSGPPVPAHTWVRVTLVLPDVLHHVTALVTLFDKATTALVQIRVSVPVEGIVQDVNPTLFDEVRPIHSFC